MNPAKAVEAEWLVCSEEIKSGDFLRALADRTFTVEHYKGFLRETYHNTTLNPRLGSLFQAHLNSGKPALEARFLKHNASELGHNNLALGDLAALGEDTEAVINGRPLPTTEAFAAFAAFQIQHRNPLAYLGYLFHLESLAVSRGAETMKVLDQMGIPFAAQSFLQEHSEADLTHMQFNRDYIDGFVQTDRDLEAVLYGLRGACLLHAGMLQGIMDETARTATTWAPGTTTLKAGS